MTTDEWTAEVRTRIAQNEGCETRVYLDTMGIPTVGIGFNLDRADAPGILADCGASYDAIRAGTAELTQEQVNEIFAVSFAPIVQEARASLDTGVFDALDDARRFVIVDLVFNLGNEGWLEFAATRDLINRAQDQKEQGHTEAAHALFGEAADHLAASAWASQVGDRATRDIAMMRTSAWVPPLPT